MKLTNKILIVAVSYFLGNQNEVMRYGSYSKKYKSSVGRLLSPVFIVPPKTCLQMGTGSNIDGHNIVHFEIETMPKEPGDHQVITITSEYMNGTDRQTKGYTYKIPSGEFRLIFKVTPQKSGVLVYLEEVTLVTDCSLYQTTTVTPAQTSSKTNIPITYHLRLLPFYFWKAINYYLWHF